LTNSNLKGYGVKIRESMKKFKGTDNVLNLIVPSKASKASLNQQAIIFLHSLGVHEKYFEEHL
jgi:hypothetical protein